MKVPGIAFRFISLGIGVSALVLSTGRAESQELQNSEVEIKSLIQKGDQALQTVTEARCMEAIRSYGAALEMDPENYEANWKTSKAYCLILDLKTAGLIEEKEEYKPLLKDLGAKAEHHAEKAYAVNPLGPEVLAWYNSSYGYHASSMGILQAILAGAGEKLKKIANELIQVDDAYGDALGYNMLGRFHLNAPFPVGSKRKAVEYLEKSVEKAPGSLFNHYWLGEAYLKEKKFEEAKKEFQFVLDHPPTQDEKHFSGQTQEAAQRRLRE